MSDDLLFRIGETKRIAHQVSGVAGQNPFVLTDVLCSIYSINPDTGIATAVLTDGQGQAVPYLGESATEHEVIYLWTPDTAGDYVYHLRYVVGSQTVGVRGELTVLPITSKVDRWVRRITDWILDTEVGEAQQLLSYRQVWDAAKTALRKYSQSHPREVLVTVNLTASVWEYDLSLLASWDAEVSQIHSLEYPVDATIQARTMLQPYQWYANPLRSKWGLVDVSPSTGQTARVVYSALHALDHTTDTCPASDFEAVTQYAAGLALLQAANEASRTSAPGIGAEIIGRTKQQEYSSQAREMQKQGMLMWRRPVYVL